MIFLEQQTTWRFRIADIIFYTNPFIPRKSRAYLFFFYFHAYIYIYAYEKKIKYISDSWAASPNPLFFTIRKWNKYKKCLQRALHERSQIREKNDAGKSEQKKSHPFIRMFFYIVWFAANVFFSTILKGLLSKVLSKKHIWILSALLNTNLSPGNLTTVFSTVYGCE